MTKREIVLNGVNGMFMWINIRRGGYVYAEWMLSSSEQLRTDPRLAARSFFAYSTAYPKKLHHRGRLIDSYQSEDWLKLSK